MIFLGGAETSLDNYTSMQRQRVHANESRCKSSIDSKVPVVKVRSDK